MRNLYQTNPFLNQRQSKVSDVINENRTETEYGLSNDDILLSLMDNE